MRRRLERLANVALRQGRRVESLVATPDGAAVTAVQCGAEGGTSETLAADLVIDASGRGALSRDLLERIGRPPVEESVVGIDITYATAVFAIPDDAPAKFKGAYLLPDAPRTSRGGLLLPIEGGRWTLTLFAAHGDQPPGDREGFVAFARSLRTQTIFDAIKQAELLGPIARYGFPGNVRRHFERLADFPRGLLPLGDAACRFNPVYGQGMSVAAQEACLLRRLLGSLAPEADPLAKLGTSYFAALATLLEAPWSTAMLDLVYPETTGPRPADFEGRLKFGAGLIRLAARDADVHKLFYEVNNLVKPPSVYRDPELQRRVMAMSAEP
jgi:2-polyprenyl-6-methoxyphenol hydroxylase-like FAD-dependent oxidoreductase